MRTRSLRQAERGFTLFEAVITMAIVAILMALAIPSYRYVTNANRIAAEINGLLGDMQYARAEAIKEGQTVTVCVSTNGTSCAGAAVSTWQNGWIVFSDVNGNGAVNAGDQILRVQSAFIGTDTFTANPASGYVIFNREGFSSSGVANAGLQITLHAITANNASTRCLFVTFAGLMTVQTYGQSNNSSAVCQ
ncbi:MAG TPA: GspH/FimT family pseudopilin [Steroidobacteraceae bacterium]|nr:GspH/FimT family pseudopilin [Steroidobacteraceae bacterium]